VSLTRQGQPQTPTELSGGSWLPAAKRLRQGIPGRRADRPRRDAHLLRSPRDLPRAAVPGVAARAAREAGYPAAHQQSRRGGTRPGSRDIDYRRQSFAARPCDRGLACHPRYGGSALVIVELHSSIHASLERHLRRARRQTGLEDASHQGRCHARADGLARGVCPDGGGYWRARRPRRARAGNRQYGGHRLGYCQMASPAHPGQHDAGAALLGQPERETRVPVG
jgi:hypothetical protein